jgi:hypothetical protein
LHLLLLLWAIAMTDLVLALLVCFVLSERKASKG